MCEKRLCQGNAQGTREQVSYFFAYQRSRILAYLHDNGRSSKYYSYFSGVLGCFWGVLMQIGRSSSPSSELWHVAKDEDELVLLVGDKSVGIAEGVEIAALIMPDSIATKF